MRKLYRRIAGALAMVLGTAGVFALLYYMNELTEPPAGEPPKQAADFSTPPPPPKPPPPKPKPKKAPRKMTQMAPAAPAPSITSALSGLSFDLPRFENSTMLGTDELLSLADSDRRMVHTSDTVDIGPRPVARKSPEYPAKARARGIEGHVTLKLEVSERGDVERVRVLEATPVGVFEEVAVAAVREWRFEPGRYKGTPVPVEVRQKIPFRLN